MVESRQQSELEIKVCSVTIRAMTSLISFQAGYLHKALLSIENFYHSSALVLEASRHSSEHQGIVQDLTTKGHTLIPFQFEATLHQTAPSFPTPGADQDLKSLATIISKARQTSAPGKTYVLLADIVLSNVSNPTSSSTNQTPPQLTLKSASILFAEIIRAQRTLQDQHDTNLSRAPRWIRCLVQLCLDAHRQTQLRETQTTPSPINSAFLNSTSHGGDDFLAVVSDLVSQALTLARIPDDTAAAPPYPAEELEWLSTTLFNLSIDIYVRSSRVSSNSNPDHQQQEGTDPNPQQRGADTAKKWAGLAVEVADVIAGYARGRGGDGGMLARLLRGRAREGLGWVF